MNRASLLTVRDALQSDLEPVVRLLMDDALGADRESPGDPAYARALEAINASSDTRFFVGVLEGRVIGCLQLNLTPGLARRGATRAVLESVRIQSALRGRGHGQALVEEAIEIARAAGAGSIALSPHASRQSAHRFYQRLGFEPSHVAMKLRL